MAERGDEKVRIVYKIKKAKGGHGHHGGSWKVAFADFMTAMMALFLCLWILAQSQEVKQAVAYYFRHATDYEGDPEAVFKGNQGLIDVRNGRMDTPPSAMGEGDKGATGHPGGFAGRSAQSFAAGAGPSRVSAKPSLRPQRPFENELDNTGGDYQKLLEIADALWDILHMEPSFERIKDQILIETTETGFVVQMIALPGEPLLEDKSVNFRKSLRQAFAVLAKHIRALKDNKVEIDGHGRGVADDPKHQWVGSFMLADLARKELIANGLQEKQITKVSGCADTRPLTPQSPSEPVNQRVSIMVHHNNWRPKMY